MENVACIVKAPIAMDYWMGIRIHLYRLLEGFIDQWIVVAVPDHICHDAPGSRPVVFRSLSFLQLVLNVLTGQRDHRPHLLFAIPLFIYTYRVANGFKRFTAFQMALYCVQFLFSWYSSSHFKASQINSFIISTVYLGGSISLTVGPVIFTDLSF